MKGESKATPKIVLLYPEDWQRMNYLSGIYGNQSEAIRKALYLLYTREAQKELDRKIANGGELQ